MAGSSKKILISPLDWGLGHATRLIPVIRYLLGKGHEVIISSYGESHHYLKQHFPGLKHILHQGMKVSYPANNRMALNMMLQAPSLLRNISEEQKITKQLVSELKPDLIFSDNRYGVYSKNVYSVFLTHQLQIQTPVLNGLVNFINHSYIRNFDECWVPDTVGSLLSGQLSSTSPRNISVKYIGPVSTTVGVKKRSIYDVCAIISGPEPQRSIFLNKVLKIAAYLPDKTFTVVINRPIDEPVSSNIKALIKASRNDVEEHILSSDLIISRPGYSTIMDLAGTNIKALFVPTPGQTEQEYLGQKLMNENVAYCVEQHALTYELIQKANEMTGFSKKLDKNIFGSELDRVLSLV